MKKFLILLIGILLTFTSCKNQNADKKIKVIFETDLGNDVDDALALDMLYKYLENDTIDLLAVMINKNGIASAELLDIMNTWYGHTNIPIGIIRDGADCETDAINYAKAVCQMKDSNGNYIFKRTLNNYQNLPDAHTLYRKILSSQPDNSVKIISVGFSTNLSRLLNTTGDEYSKLSGRELIKKKVSLLSVMAGCMNDTSLHEYNVVKDIPAAKKVFNEWPTDVVVSPFEVGISITYPGKSIENDFKWAKYHPVIEAYKSYLPMPYDRPTWDLTSVLYAVENEGWFTLSPKGKIMVKDNGSTIFNQCKDGNIRYLITDQTQQNKIKNHFINLITSKPKKYDK
jgi:Inosine-uridine nucleoside N-ribohydrolase